MNSFDDLIVAAKDTIDFYSLFFPYQEKFNGGNIFTLQINGDILDFKSPDMVTDTFEKGYRYWFDVTMTDSGLQWTDYVASAYDEYIEITSETNAGLCEYLASEIYGAYLDGEGNVFLPKEVVEATTSMDIGGNTNVGNLEGLECFTNLTKLYCDNCGLTSLDVSSFTNLQYLDCYYNELTSLDLSNNTVLETLNCSYNNLDSLNLSTNLTLYNLSCCYNNLTTLDLSNHTALRFLYCHNNKLTSLDLSNTSLDYLYCYNNKLTSLDLSKNTALTTLKIDGNLLSELDIRDLPNLIDLTCGNQTNSSGEEQTLTLTLYESQSTLWDDLWVYFSENYNVEINVGSDTTEESDTENETGAEA